MRQLVLFLLMPTDVYMEIPIPMSKYDPLAMLKWQMETVKGNSQWLKCWALLL
jgi:hypothetical protein